MLLITGELLLNVWLFFLITGRSKIHQGVALALSVLASKGVYYLLKFALISTLLIEGSLVSTPLWVQALMLLAFSIYLGLLRKPINSPS